MAVGELREQIAQKRIGFDTVHFAGANQAGEASPVTTTFVMASEERIAAVHGRAADGVFDEVGVDVDATILEEQPEAVLTFQHVGHGLTEVRFARHTRGLGRQPGEERIDQRARQLLPDSPATIRVRATDGVLDLVERRDAQQRRVDDGRSLLGRGLDQLPAAMGPAEGKPQRIATRAFRRRQMGVAAIGIDLDRALEAGKDFSGIFALSPGPVVEHHAGWRRTVPAAIIAQHCPEISGFRLATPRV